MAEGLDDRGLYTHVGSMFDGTVCTDAGELARVYGGPVFEPTWWPLDTEAVHYVVPAQPPAPIPVQPPSYYIFVTPSDDARSPVVIGFEEPSTVVGTAAGWRALDELGDAEAHVRDHAGSAEIVVRRDDQTVHIGPFASTADAVAMARGLRRVDPPA